MMKPLDIVKPVNGEPFVGLITELTEDGRVSVTWFDNENANRAGLVTELKHSFACEATRKGYNIVIDNMNLNPKEVKWWEDIIKVANSITEFEYELEFKDFFVSVDECIRRDAMREQPMGAKVIKDTWRRYRDFIIQEDIKNMLSKSAEHVDGGHPVILVDMDATLCLNTTGRPYYGDGSHYYGNCKVEKVYDN